MFTYSYWDMFEYYSRYTELLISPPVCLCSRCAVVNVANIEGCEQWRSGPWGVVLRIGMIIRENVLLTSSFWDECIISTIFLNKIYRKIKLLYSVEMGFGILFLVPN